MYTFCYKNISSLNVSLFKCNQLLQYSATNSHRGDDKETHHCFKEPQVTNRVDEFNKGKLFSILYSSYFNVGSTWGKKTLVKQTF